MRYEAGIPRERYLYVYRNVFEPFGAPFGARHESDLTDPLSKWAMGLYSVFVNLLSSLGNIPIVCPIRCMEKLHEDVCLLLMSFSMERYLTNVDFENFTCIFYETRVL